MPDEPGQDHQGIEGEMTARIFKFVGMVACALTLAVAAPARAGIGEGIRLGTGEGVLHPFLEVSAGFDSNVFATNSGSAGAMAFHIRPGLKLDVPDELLVIDARAAVEWVQYVA